MEMRRTRRIDGEHVRWVRGNDRRRASKSSERETFECCGVALRICMVDDQIPDQGPRLGRRHSDAQAGRLCRSIGREHDTTRAVVADKNERHITRKRRVARFPSDAVG